MHAMGDPIGLSKSPTMHFACAHLTTLFVYIRSKSVMPFDTDERGRGSRKRQRLEKVNEKVQKKLYVRKRPKKQPLNQIVSQNLLLYSDYLHR